MASDLDSFFAKKEKRRLKKGFNKATAVDLGKKIAKNIEKQNKEDEARDLEKMNVASTIGRDGDDGNSTDPVTANLQINSGLEVQNGTAGNDVAGTTTDDDDGWIVVDQKTNNDLSDLKIGEMSLADHIIESSDDSSSSPDESRNADSLTDLTGGRVAKQNESRTSENPWGTAVSVVDDVTNNEVDASDDGTELDGMVYQAPIMDVRIKDKLNANKDVYVPPNARNKSHAVQESAYQFRRRPRKEAPDITNEEMFPSLGGQPASRTPAMYVDKKTTDKLQGSTSNHGRLVKDNKFSALSGDHN